MPDELLDVVNENDIVTGQELRSVIHRTGLQHRGVHVFLVTADNRLLVQRRGKDQDSFPLALDCSVSEHVKAGEEYFQAAERGLREELGICNVHLNALVKFQMEYGLNDFEICILYEGIVDPGLIRANPQEVENITAYQLNEIIEIMHKGEETLCSWFIQMINWYLDQPSILNILKVFSNDSLLQASIKSRYQQGSFG